MLLFVGERRSATAVQRGWTWKDGHLAAATLFDALEYSGINPAHVHFTNIFERGGQARVRTVSAQGGTVVALGKKVQRRLKELGVEYVPLVHPAARGRIRKKSRYNAHVRNTLRRTYATSGS